MGNKYTLGAQVMRLAYETGNPNSLNQRLMPFLLELYELARGVVSLAILDRGSVVRYTDPLYDRAHVQVAYHRRAGVPVHCSAAGKLLLAYAQPAVVDLGPGPLSSMTPYTITCVDDLRAELAVIRRRGVAYAREEYVYGEVELAVPVFDPRGHVLAGLTVAGHVDQTDLASVAVSAGRVAHAASVYLRLCAQPSTRHPGPASQDQTRSKSYA